MGLLEVIEKDLVSRFNKVDLKRVANNAAQSLDDRKNKTTESYRSPIKGKPKFVPYNAKYAQRKGVGRNSVDLRSKGSNSIERTKVNAKGNSKGASATIRWRDKKKGDIFGFHQEGAGRLPKRQIFPERAKQVPDEITELISDSITAEILSQTVR